MARMTNKLNYPEAVYNAAKASLHRPEDGIYGITSLIGPPAIYFYRRERWDELEFDVDDFLWSLFGIAWHSFLTTHAGGAQVAEESLMVKVNDVIIRGQLDVRNFDGRVEDYKVTSGWSFVFAKPEWEQQLNAYAQLCTSMGYKVTELVIHAFLRDWSELNAMRYNKYPKRKFHTVNVPLWSEEKRKQFILDRIQDHKNGPRPCTPDERWQKETTYAVKKTGVQRARKCFDEKHLADEYISSQKKNADLYIETRPGQCVRCERYCPARTICEYR